MTSKLLFAFLALSTSYSAAHADPMSEFNDCINTKLRAAQEVRLQAAEFESLVKSSCTREEYAFVVQSSELVSGDDDKAFAEKLASHAQDYVRGTRAHAVSFYEKWYSLTR